MNSLPPILMMALLVACSPMARTVLADVIVVEDNWNSGAEGWSVFFGDAAISDPDGANPWLAIDFPASGAPGDPSIIKVQANVFFPSAGGVWTNGYWVEFDFWASDVLPQELHVAWRGGDGSREWSTELDLGGMQTNEWTHFRTVPLVPGMYESWKGDLPYTAEQMLADLQDVDWIGIEVMRGSTSEEKYRLDNFQLWVPEPAEMALLLAALVTTGASCRRRKKVTPSVGTGASAAESTR